MDEGVCLPQLQAVRDGLAHRRPLVSNLSLRFVGASAPVCKRDKLLSACHLMLSIRFLSVPLWGLSRGRGGRLFAPQAFSRETGASCWGHRGSPCQGPACRPPHTRPSPEPRLPLEPAQRPGVPSVASAQPCLPSGWSRQCENKAVPWLHSKSSWVCVPGPPARLCGLGQTACPL